MPSLVDTQTLQDASTEDLHTTVVATVDAAPTAEGKKQVAAAAAESLNPDQRVALAKELAGSQWPTESRHKLLVYVTGFVVAGLVAIGVSLVAWAAQGGDDSIAPELVVLATGFTSLILGGLVGAYVQK